MGFLNNTTITIDAILTKRGRELLARGRNEFAVTKFSSVSLNHDVEPLKIISPSVEFVFFM